MPERKFVVQPVGVDYVCDACGEGVMRLDNLKLSILSPPKWRHICGKCGHRQDLDGEYPKIRFERVSPC